VHRDLKPDNVMLVPDREDGGERTKLLDFGIAKLGDLATAKYTQTGALMGTPLYMAPEQARAAGGIDHRADLYSLGCMMYEMLVGEPPFIAVGAGEIIALQLFGTAQRPSERTQGIPRALDSIVMRLLEKEPAMRFQSAAEVGDALAAAFGPAGVKPVPPLAAGEARPALIRTTLHAPRRRRSRWLLALAAATLVAGGITFALTRQRRDKPAQAPVPNDPPPVQIEAAKPAPVVETPAPVIEAPAPPPVEPSSVKPIKREKNRDQKGSASPPRYTKQGSPIETDVD
jgi:hypothetical protein